MNVAKRRVLAIVVLAAVLVLTHCRQESSSEKVSDKVEQLLDKTDNKIETLKEAAEKKVEEVGVTVDDAAITTRIKAEMLGDPLLKAASIEVMTIGGVVQLQGGVNSQKSVDRAGEIAGSIENVKSVDNRLAVKGY